MFASVRRTSHASTQLAYTAAYSASVADATMTGIRVLKVKIGWLNTIVLLLRNEPLRCLKHSEGGFTIPCEDWSYPTLPPCTVGTVL